MNEFFRGWRRKIGCIMLFIACVLSVLWYRSLFFGDRLVVGRLAGVSQDGAFSLGPMAGTPGLTLKTRELHVEMSGTSPGGGTWQIKQTQWSRVPPVIPYWPFAVLLTPLSAFLILWKPRKRS